MLRRYVFSLVGALALLVAGLVEPVSAAPAQRTWVGPASGGLWSTAANWSPTGPLENGDQLVFNHPTTSTIDDVPGLSLARLDVNAGPGARRVDITAAGGATLTLTGPVVVGGGVDLHLAVPVVLGGDVTVDVAATASFERRITGTGPLRKSGLGDLHLDDGSGTSTFSGSVLAQTGRVIPHSDTALGSGAVVFTQGVLVLEGGLVLPNTIFALFVPFSHTYLLSTGENELTGNVEAPNGQMDVASGTLTLSGLIEDSGGNPSSITKIVLGELVVATEGSGGRVRVEAGPASIVTPDGVRAADGIVVGGSGHVTHFGDDQIEGVTTFSGSVYDLLGTNQSMAEMVSISGDLYLGIVNAGVVDASVLETPDLTTQSSGTVVFAVGPGMPGVGHDQIRAGRAAISSHLALDVGGLVPVGTTIVLVDITGPDPWNGNRFVGLDQGAVFEAGGAVWLISYIGGTGNDITITRIPGAANSRWSFEMPRLWVGHTRHVPAASSFAGTRVDVWETGLDNGLWHQWSNEPGVVSGSEALGGILTSAPAATSWNEAHLAVLGRGSDGALWLRTYAAGWLPWESLGGQIVGAPAVTSDLEGHLDVFARGIDGALWHRGYDNGTWRGWESLGGGLTGAPAVASWEHNRHDVFIRGLDNALWHLPFIDGVWGTWESLGGIVTGSPATVAPAPDQLLTMARGADGRAWARSWEAAGWSNWTPTGLTVLDGVGLAARDGSTVTAFFRSADDRVLYTDGSG